jgi:hypothetical protein
MISKLFVVQGIAINCPSFCAIGLQGLGSVPLGVPSSSQSCAKSFTSHCTSIETSAEAQVSHDTVQTSYSIVTVVHASLTSDVYVNTHSAVNSNDHPAVQFHVSAIVIPFTASKSSFAIRSITTHDQAITVPVSAPAYATIGFGSDAFSTPSLSQSLVPSLISHAIIQIASVRFSICAFAGSDASAYVGTAIRSHPVHTT